jgi:hypothetical protein
VSNRTYVLKNRVRVHACMGMASQPHLTSAPTLATTPVLQPGRGTYVVAETRSDGSHAMR